jgi:hypothetical protein
MATKHLSSSAPVWAPFAVYSLITALTVLLGGR